MASNGGKKWRQSLVWEPVLAQLPTFRERLQSRAHRKKR
jgi:hypothetical protein